MKKVALNNIEAKNTFNVWEIFVSFIVLLSITQIIVEEFGIIFELSGRFRQSVLLLRFFFDLFFSIEFIVRLIIAIFSRKLIKYFFFEKGWIDLLASFPLLIFYSTPIFVELLDINVFGIGKVYSQLYSFALLKGIRLFHINGILKFIRFLKIFGRIKNPDSSIARRHTTNIATISILTVVLGVTLSNFFFPIVDGNLDKVQSHYNKILRQTYQFIQQSDELNLNYEDTDGYTKNYLKELFYDEEDFVLVEIKRIQDDDWGNSKILYSKYEEKEFREKFVRTDVYNVDFLNLRIILTNFPTQKISAKLNLMITLIIVIIILFQFVYGKYFTKNISDVIYCLIKGFREKSFKDDIKYNNKDELGELVREYNKNWLSK